MGNKIEFTVENKPQGKARARTFYNPRMGKMQSITPQQTKNYEDLIRWSYMAAGGQYFGEKLIKVEIQAFYQIPARFNKKMRAAAIADEIRPTTKPDVDNCAKAVLDALNGVCYLDDRQVIDLHISKHYTAESPYTKITIFAL